MRIFKNRQLAYIEKQKILADLAEGLVLLDLAKELGRNKRALVSYVEKQNTTPRKDKDTRSDIFPSNIYEKITQAEQ